ncbi:MAG: LytTR family DNA-binding domain-containing protein [Terracidiphilus sp.]|jgi:two-component system LytT family response regulator
MVIRVLIVDDEPLARKGIALRLREYPDIEIVGMCSDGKQAIQRIPELAPDLVFLDIQMPLVSGIEVLRALPAETVPVIIFLTAFDEHALAAFEVQALDYLLKPIDEVRFFAAVERARRLIKLKQQSALYDLAPIPQEAGREARNLDPLKRFAVRKGKELTFVEASTIDWIEAAGDYAELHVKDKTYLIRESLNTLETLLDRNDFLRIHRSAIIRLDRIVRITALANRDGYLTLTNGTSLRVSRSYSKRLKNLLRNRKSAEA